MRVFKWGTHRKSLLAVPHPFQPGKGGVEPLRMFFLRNYPLSVLVARVTGMPIKHRLRGPEQVVTMMWPHLATCLTLKTSITGSFEDAFFGVRIWAAPGKEHCFSMGVICGQLGPFSLCTIFVELYGFAYRMSRLEHHVDCRSIWRLWYFEWLTLYI